MVRIPTSHRLRLTPYVLAEGGAPWSLIRPEILSEQFPEPSVRQPACLLMVAAPIFRLLNMRDCAPNIEGSSAALRTSAWQYSTRTQLLIRISHRLDWYFGSGCKELVGGRATRPPRALIPWHISAPRSAASLH